MYSAEVQDLKNEFTFTTELNESEREVLLSLPNPQYSEIINKYDHLDGLQMHDTDTKIFTYVLILSHHQLISH